MAQDASRPDHASAARSRLAALDRHRRAAPTPGELRQRARTLLRERFGPGDAAAAGFARGATGLVAEHTHYSDGFALLMPLAQGTAVAARPAALAPSRLAFAGEAGTWTADAASEGEQPLHVHSALAVLRAFADGPVEAAVTSAVPQACFDAFHSALGVAAARATAALVPAPVPDPERPDGWDRVASCLAEGTGAPFSLAHVMAAAAGTPPQWLLADTATHEHLPVEALPAEQLSRGLITTVAGGAAGTSLAQPAAFHRKRRQQAEEALRLLRAGGFDALTAFRDLEHRDLDRAMNLLPPALQPVAQHLITENRRVQKLVRAARHGDAQLFGALLLMSHASLAEDWRSAPAPLSAIVEAGEVGEGGLYGARMTGRGPCVLALGRPGALLDFFRHATRVLRETFDLDAEAMLL